MKSAPHPEARPSRLQALFDRVELIPSWLRFGCFTTVLAVVGVLSLSDSVGASYTQPIAFAMKLVSALVPGSGLNPVGAVDLPGGIDTLGHFVVWGSVGFMASVLIPAAASRINALSALWALSALIEVGQKYLSHSRAAQLSDLMANGTGLVVGSVVAAVALAWGQRLVQPPHTAASIVESSQPKRYKN